MSSDCRVVPRAVKTVELRLERVRRLTAEGPPLSLGEQHQLKPRALLITSRRAWNRALLPHAH